MLIFSKIEVFLKKQLIIINKAIYNNINLINNTEIIKKID